MAASLPFDSQSVERIANAVLRVEKMPKTTGYGPSRYRATDDGFWAQITDSDGSTNKYSWVAVSPSSGGTWSQESDWGSGTYNNPDDDPSNLYACEFTGCIDVIKNDFVWLFPAPGQSFYSFLYAPPCRYASLSQTLTGSSGHVTVGSQTINVYNLIGGTVPQNPTNLPLSVLIAYTLINGVGRWEVIKWNCTS